MAEISDERQMTDDQLSGLPPCSVEIVLGAKGQLFVVLPTGVETELPFASNAPFIQDPSRLKIKDPEISPANRWLLARIGELAAQVALEWLGRSDLTVQDRIRAYGILPATSGTGNPLENACAQVAESASDATLAGQPFLLTEAEDLVGINRAVIIPNELLDVWDPHPASSCLDPERRPPLSRYVSSQDREKLVRKGYVESIGRQDVLARLQECYLPKPESWSRLLKLWAYIAPDVIVPNWRLRKKELRIVPVQAKDFLYGADEVVRIGKDRLLQSADDWQFLEAHLKVINPNWPRFLTEQTGGQGGRGAEAARHTAEAAQAVLREIGLNDASDVDEVAERVAAQFFGPHSVPLADCIRFAQIAAKLKVATGPSFRFRTVDGELRPSKEILLWDSDGHLEVLLPPEWRPAHLLDSDYSDANKYCRDEWRGWVTSGKSALLGLPP